MNEFTFRRPQLAGVAPGTDEQDPNRESAPARVIPPTVVRYFRLAQRWKWLLIGMTITSLLLGLVVTLLMTPQYTATATIEIQRESARIVNVQGVEPEASPIDQEFYQTQYGLLRAQTLANQVVNDLRLYENANFFQMYGDAKTAEEIQQGPQGAASSRAERVRDATKILLRNIEVDPTRLSRLVTLHFTSPDPTFSANVVNAWTRLFIETSLSRRFEATAYARRFLEERLGQLRQRLQESERDLVRYAANERIISIPANTQGGATVERPLVAEDLAAANGELNAATAARVAAQSRLRAPGGTTTEALSNQTISELRTQRTQLAADRVRLLAQFEPDYPPAQALADQIAELDRALAREETRIRDTLRTTFESAEARENASRSRVRGLEGSLLDLRGRTIQYNIFEREVDTNRQLYDALLQRYKEIGVAGGVGVNNISVVDPAQVPEKPSSPRILINLFLAGLFGVAAGVGLALLFDQADEAISDPRELEDKLGLPLLGAIPRSADDEPIADLDDPKSDLVEAYLSAQTRLAFTTDHGVPRTLAVTSARPGEGKSTTVYALARTLARTSRRVVVVDADMRSPSQHVIFGVDNDRGLSNYLSGGEGGAKSIHAPPAAMGVSVMTAGPTPPNAAELLTSARFGQLIEELASEFDHVIVDAPPIMGLADTPLIATKVEGSIFVIQSRKTRATVAQMALERLRASRARVVGGVLTMFDSKRAEYGYGYEYGYGERDGQTT